MVTTLSGNIKLTYMGVVPEISCNQHFIHECLRSALGKQKSAPRSFGLDEIVAKTAPFLFCDNFHMTTIIVCQLE
jgi:hypothetical protein